MDHGLFDRQLINLIELNVKMINVRILISSFLTICLLQANAQNVKEKKPAVEVIGRADKHQITLRWAPNEPYAWRTSMTYGFAVERYTIMRDSVLLTRPEKGEVRTIKPWALADWKQLTEEDDYGAIAAQAIYGETFEVTEDFTSDITQVINKVHEIENRFSFALFAADHSPKVAEASGLWYVDKNVKSNERYLYRVYSLTPKAKVKIDTGYVYIGVNDFEPLPVIQQVETTLSEKSVIVSWPGRDYSHHYNSYIVERSDDGGATYHSIAEVPIINTTADGNSEFMFKTDSITVYDKKFYYRVKGINAFGETGPNSAPVSVEAHPLLKFMPRINRTRLNPNGTITVGWEFSDDGQKQITGFKLLRSDQARGHYKEIQQDISAQTREVFDRSPANSNYYVIAAYDRYGNESRSYPVLEMLNDSIPPSQPVQLIGKIDTLGIVTLRWKENTEPDINGYRVYRANFEDQEFLQITRTPVSAASYTDTVVLNTLTRKIFYKVVAIDKRFNPSEFSTSVAIERPDVIPPASPSFNTVTLVKNGIAMAWNNSPSDDVSKEVLYRKSSKDKGWIPIKIFHTSDSVHVFVDSLVQNHELYAYTLIAVDKQGLESVPSKPVTQKVSLKKNYAKVEYVNSKVNRQEKFIELQWTYSEDVSGFRIYRGVRGGAISLYKVLGNTKALNFKDKDLVINTHYTYKIQAEFKDGALSPLSDELNVNY